VYGSSTVCYNHRRKRINNYIGATNCGTGTDNICYSTETDNNIFYCTTRKHNIIKPTTRNNDIECFNPGPFTLSIRLSCFIGPASGCGQPVSNYHSKRSSSR
jgi:hypothetical protein